MFITLSKPSQGSFSSAILTPNFRYMKHYCQVPYQPTMNDWLGLGSVYMKLLILMPPPPTSHGRRRQYDFDLSACLCVRMYDAPRLAQWKHSSTDLPSTSSLCFDMTILRQIVNIVHFVIQQLTTLNRRRQETEIAENNVITSTKKNRNRCQPSSKDQAHHTDTTATLHLGPRNVLSVWCYYYYAAFNAPCVGHNDDESLAQKTRCAWSLDKG